MRGGARPLVVANWKLHKTISETVAFVQDIRKRSLPLTEVEAVICPPFTALAAARDALAGSVIGLGAQNMCWAEEGAFTGEIGAPMLVELGVRWVILGHSERRLIFGERDAQINAKVKTALAAGITPIVAVGETAEEHAAGGALTKVQDQTRAAFAGLSPEEVARCVVAYEPIWAIGTGHADSPQEANAIMGEIRRVVDGLADVRILYGGSVKPENVTAFVAQPNIDGGLVGGASLDPASFTALLEGARKGVHA
jgi:triosephosphate isomerase